MPTLTRSDALPEYHEYVDEGCEHYPLCLACPLPRCRFDVPGGIRSLHNRERDPVIVRDYWEFEVPVDAIARRYAISKRSVYRVVAGARRAVA